MPMCSHGCGASVNSENETILVVFGGLSGVSDYHNEVITMNLKQSGNSWHKLQYVSLPYSNIILKSFIFAFTETNCETMFVGYDGLYTCKKNFNWTHKPMTITNGTKYSWMGIGRLNACGRNWGTTIKI